MKVARENHSDVGCGRVFQSYVFDKRNEAPNRKGNRMKTQHDLASAILFQVAVIKSDLVSATASATLENARPHIESAGRQLDIMRRLLV